MVTCREGGHGKPCSAKLCSKEVLCLLSRCQWWNCIQSEEGMDVCSPEDMPWLGPGAWTTITVCWKTVIVMKCRHTYSEDDFKHPDPLGKVQSSWQGCNDVASVPSSPSMENFEHSPTSLSAWIPPHSPLGINLISRHYQTEGEIQDETYTMSEANMK